MAKKGYTAQEKLDKKKPDEALKKRRYAFAMKHIEKDAAVWKTFLQAVADMKLFTFYPKVLKPIHKQLRARWTYMNKKERYQTPFQRPKQWFSPKEYEKTKKQKVFGFTTSTGKILAFLVPPKYTAEKWAQDVHTKVAPFLKRCFPGKTEFKVLLDGEKLLHAPVAKAALRRHGIQSMPGWPKNRVFHNRHKGF